MSPTRPSASGGTAAADATATGEERNYRIPVVGAAVPARLVETGFWGSLLGAAVLGAVDPPLALLLGAGVAVARHRRS